jgi:hypothetical protein
VDGHSERDFHQLSLLKGAGYSKKMFKIVLLGLAFAPKMWNILFVAGAVYSSCLFVKKDSISGGHGTDVSSFFGDSVKREIGRS